MSETGRNTSGGRYGNVLIIAVAVVLLAVVVMYFLDRQQKRNFELHRFEQRMELLGGEQELPEQKGQPANAPGTGGRIL